MDWQSIALPVSIRNLDPPFPSCSYGSIVYVLGDNLNRVCVIDTRTLHTCMAPTAGLPDSEEGVGGNYCIVLNDALHLITRFELYSAAIPCAYVALREQPCSWNTNLPPFVFKRRSIEGSSLQRASFLWSSAYDRSTCTLWTTGGYDISTTAKLELNNISNTSAKLRWERVATTGRHPVNRYCHGCAVDGNKLWVVGGRNATGSKFNDVHTLDLCTLSWSSVITDNTVPNVLLSSLVVTPGVSSSLVAVGMKLMNGMPYTVSMDPHEKRVTRLNPSFLINDGCLGVATKAFVVNSKLNVIASVCGGGYMYQTQLPVPWCPESHRSFTFGYQQMVLAYLAVLACLDEYLPLELLCSVFAYVADDVHLIDGATTQTSASDFCEQPNIVHHGNSMQVDTSPSETVASADTVEVVTNTLQSQTTVVRGQNAVGTHRRKRNRRRFCPFRS